MFNAVCLLENTMGGCVYSGNNSIFVGMDSFPDVKVAKGGTIEPDRDSYLYEPNRHDNLQIAPLTLSDITPRNSIEFGINPVSPMSVEKTQGMRAKKRVSTLPSAYSMGSRREKPVHRFR